jgi:hypothetical protein
MASIDTTLHWLVRLSLAGGLAILYYLLSEGPVRSLFSAERIGPTLLFGGAWILPAVTLGTWSNAATGRQSIVFYVLSLASIALITVLGMITFVLESAFG